MTADANTTTWTAGKFRFAGITDECVECQRCGKPDLKSTVVLEVLDADGNGGEFTYFGSTCAARALGGTWTGPKALQAARNAQWQRDQQRAFHEETLAVYVPVEHGTVREKADVYFKRNPHMRGKAQASEEVARIIRRHREALQPLTPQVSPPPR